MFKQSYDVMNYQKNRFWRKNKRPVSQALERSNCFGVDLNRNFDYKWMSKFCNNRF
jgi:hypothetical protein